jgi:hypothetical protein
VVVAVAGVADGEGGGAEGREEELMVAKSWSLSLLLANA